MERDVDYKPLREGVQELFKRLGDQFPGHTYGDLSRVAALEDRGYCAGLQGWYPNGDFSSDADFCYGPAQEMEALAELFDVESDEFFELYSKAHAEGLADGPRLVYIALKRTSRMGSWEVIGVRRSVEEARKLRPAPVLVSHPDCIDIDDFQWKIEAHAIKDDPVPEED